MTVAILIILIGQNPRLALFTVMPLPLITMTLILIGNRIGHLFRAVQAGFSRMSDQAQEVLSGIRVVKAFVKEHYFLKRFAAANDQLPTAKHASGSHLGSILPAGLLPPPASHC